MHGHPVGWDNLGLESLEPWIDKRLGLGGDNGPMNFGLRGILARIKWENGGIICEGSWGCKEVEEHEKSWTIGGSNMGTGN